MDVWQCLYRGRSGEIISVRCGVYLTAHMKQERFTLLTINGGVVTNDDSVKSTIIVQCTVYDILWRTMPNKPCYNSLGIQYFDYEIVIIILASMVQLVLLLCAEGHASWNPKLPAVCVMGFHHDEVISLKFFSRYWPFVRGIHWSSVNSLHKASDAELWCFLWSVSEQMVKYTIVRLEIWDAIARVIVMNICRRIKWGYHVLWALCQGRSVFIMFAFNGELG